MKLTTEQIKQIIREELEAGYTKEFDAADTGKALRLLSQKILQLEREMGKIKEIIQSSGLAKSHLDSKYKD